MTTSHSLSRFAAAGLGSGWLPKAPGTWGSLAALLPGWLLLKGLGLGGVLFAVFLITAFGCYLCSRLLPSLESNDPGWIVIDEWAGQWLCMALMALGGLQGVALLLLSFVMFRLFDILKPWPVSWLERTGPDWWTIMADDLGAGILGAATGIVVILLTGWGG